MNSKPAPAQDAPAMLRAWIERRQYETGAANIDGCAKELGVHPTYLSQLVNRRRTINKLDVAKRFSVVCGIPAEAWLRVKVDPTKRRGAA